MPSFARLRSLSARASRSLAAPALCVAAALLAPRPAAAQATLISGFGGPNDYGNQCLSPNDDGSSASIDLAAAFPTGLNFFGTRHTRMFVNTNGNITFNDAVGTYTPSAFPIATQPMIAPYWADVDIRGQGVCSGFGGDLWATCMIRPGGANGVYWALEAGRIVVTWDNVGYFACHDDLQMSFQLVLSRPADCAADGDFDVEFRYNECGWNTGDASGGTNGFSTPSVPSMSCTTDADCSGGFFSNSHCEAGTCWEGVPGQAGFDAGNLRDFVEIMGSRTNSIHTILCRDSNVGVPGVWRFQIRSGVVVCPGAGEVCDTGMLGVCQEGRTRCVADTLACEPVVPSSAEACDGLDNDCDGTVDDTSDGPICPGTAICDQGVCVDTCFEGACPETLACDEASGRCVEPLCVGVTCPPGERCSRGVCGDACAGVVCPLGQSCRAGRCVDFCDVVTCDACTVCDGGSCVERCDTAGCPPALACAPDGRCVEPACVSVSCGPGTACVGGTCVDACASAACPTGQRCVAGDCVPLPVMDAGVRPRDAGPPAMVDAGSDLDAGAVLMPVDANVDACRDPACLGVPTGRRGCSCSVPGRAGDRAPRLLALLAALVALVAARRRVR